MELRLPHMLHLFNVFHENKDSDNCAQLLEEECNKITKSLLCPQHTQYNGKLYRCTSSAKIW